MARTDAVFMKTSARCRMRVSTSREGTEAVSRRYQSTQVPPSMFAGYHYTLNPKKPGYDGLWGTHPEFGLMRGTENIIGTVRSRRVEVLRWFHFIHATRVHQTRF